MPTISDVVIGICPSKAHVEVLLASRLSGEHRLEFRLFNRQGEPQEKPIVSPVCFSTRPVEGFDSTLPVHVLDGSQHWARRRTKVPLLPSNARRVGICVTDPVGTTHYVERKRSDFGLGQKRGGRHFAFLLTEKAANRRLEEIEAEFFSGRRDEVSMTALSNLVLKLYRGDDPILLQLEASED